LLTIYRSNRAEWLARIVSEELKATPPVISEKVEILVSTWPTSRWLGDQLALVNGINGQVNFPFPGNYLRELVGQILGEEVNKEDPWKASNLVWPLLNLIPKITEKKEGASLKEWIESRPSQSNVINKDIWQLACSIAKAFDDYILYRPDLTKKWCKSSNEEFNSLVKDLPSKLQWQPSLFRLLSKVIKNEPFSIDVERAIDLLRDNKSALTTYSKELRLFGISNLAPLHINLIQAISGEVDVKVYLLTPCLDLWHRHKKRRTDLGKEWERIPDGSWLLNSTRLEASLGRMGAEFQQLLEGSGEYQLGEINEEDLFALPAAISKNQSKTPTLLEQLQESLVKSEGQESLQRSINDDSLLFVECPGRRREVELVRDQIIQWLANDTSLEPRDILIMTPQIKRFSPLIASVFNDVGSTKVSLPWRITDRSQNDKPGLIKYILQLLDLASERFSASGLYDLMTNTAFHDLYKLDQEDIEHITTYLQRTGFRWGIDSEERKGDEVHSLLWALDRWLLGIVIPSIPRMTHGELAPMPIGVAPKELLKWWRVLTQVAGIIKEMRRPKTCAEWSDYLRVILKNTLTDKDDWIRDYQSLLTSIEDWRRVASESQMKVESTVVKEILQESLSKESGRFGHSSGSITISELEPMRAIPHRIIVLMGLDEEIFPHSIERNSFNFLEQKRYLGDPNPNHQDRYALLEALMSTRQHLMLTWNSRDEKTGDHLEAASPIQQWLDYLINKLNNKDAETLLRRPPTNPLDTRNFLPNKFRPPISCDSRNLQACKLINKSKKIKPLGIAMPLRWTKQKISSERCISNELLKSWLIAPQKIWLLEQQMRTKDWINLIENEEKYNLDEAQRYQLLKTRLENNLTSCVKSKKTKENVELNFWEKETKGQGILPYKSGKFLEIDLLDTRWGNLMKLIDSIGNFKKEILQLNYEYQELIWAGDYHIEIEVGRLKNKSIMEGWVKHLQICANGLSTKGTMIISRSSKEEFEIFPTWKPIEKGIAIELLKTLKQLALKGLFECWPVPPESGWIYTRAKNESPEKANDLFKKRWSGDLYIEGESNKEEMKICFGNNCEATCFLDNLDFHEALTLLYEPIIKNLL
tara:strand:+ start:10388 stop:13684 length:3297 start_codon:yes stop_codon:yes gene_type:complete